MWEWFDDLRRTDRTLLVTGHYMVEAERCDRVAVLVGGALRAIGTPSELRRQALGGEIIELVVKGPSSLAVDVLGHFEPVHRIDVRGSDLLWLTVDDAGEALPGVVDRLHKGRVEVRSIEPINPPFDVVYEQLVRHVA
jgi:ABC-2 type transport system ATP-binding protein